MRMIITAESPRRRRAVVHGRLVFIGEKSISPIRAAGVSGKWRVPRVGAGLDRTPVFIDQVKQAISMIAEGGKIGATATARKHRSHERAGHAIAEVIIDEQARGVVIEVIE